MRVRACRASSTTSQASLTSEVDEAGGQGRVGGEHTTATRLLVAMGEVLRCQGVGRNGGAGEGDRAIAAEEAEEADPSRGERVVWNRRWLMLLTALVVWS